MARDSARIYDEFLVACAVTGDRQAMGRLVARWDAPLHRHAWRLLGDPQSARDAVQDAWIHVLRGLARLDDPAAFPAWAYRIVTRRCHRGLARARHDLPLEAEFAEGLPDPEASRWIDAAIDLPAVQAAMARLPAVQRATLALFYLEDMSVAQVAVATDVPPGTVKTRLMHARNKVRVLLEGEQQ